MNKTKILNPSLLYCFPAVRANICFIVPLLPHILHIPHTFTAKLSVNAFLSQQNKTTRVRDRQDELYSKGFVKPVFEIENKNYMTFEGFNQYKSQGSSPGQCVNLVGNFKSS